MAGEFFPRREAELRFWSAALASKLVAAPQDYGISQQAADEYAQIHAQFAQAYERALNPATATRAARVEKRRAKAALIAQLRMTGGLVKHILTSHGAPPDATKKCVLLGLNPRRRGGRNTRLPRPQAAPTVCVESVVGPTAQVQLLDPQSQGRRSRPRGVKGANIYRFVGTNPPHSMSQWQFVRDTIHTRFPVEIPASVPPGAKVFITAQWKNPRGQTGPLSGAVCLSLTGAGSALRPSRGVRAA